VRWDVYAVTKVLNLPNSQVLLPTICGRAGKWGAHYILLFEQNVLKVKVTRNIQPIHSGLWTIPSVPERTLYPPNHNSRNRDGVAGIAIGRSSSPGRIKNFLFSTSSRSALGFTQPPIQRVPGALSSEVKQPGREADQSPPANVEIKKMWLYTSTPPYAFMG
jgi:hypothetical protein